MLTRGPHWLARGTFQQDCPLPKRSRDRWGWWLILFLLGEAWALGWGPHTQSCLPDSSQLSWRSESLSFQVRAANQDKSFGFLGCLGQEEAGRQGALRKTAGWAWSKQKQGGQWYPPVSKPCLSMECTFCLCLCPWASNSQGHLYHESVFCSLLTLNSFIFQMGKLRLKEGKA